MQVSITDIEKSKKILKSLHVNQNVIVCDIVDNPRIGWEEKFKKDSSKLLIEDDLKEWNDL